MSYQSDLALLAGGSYWDIRQDDRPETPEDEGNRAPLPEGWQVLTQFDKPDSGPNAVTGFSARVFKNIQTGEVVISYSGTEFGNTSANGTIADFINGNIPLSIGRYAEQALRAAQLYQEVKADGRLGSNITFTGHSLGGGLAAMMAVWFNRPATVFAAAPFQLSADSWQSTIFPDSISALVLPRVRHLLGSNIDAALKNYNPATDFAAREANVSAYAIKGELLEANLGLLNWIERTSTPLFNSSAITLDAGNKHSIDLHVAALLVPNFAIQAGNVPNALTLLMDPKLYGGDVLGNQQLLLTKLIRNEVGVRDDAGNIILAANGMLTHFAADLQKLGTNIAGLNQAAQNAIIAHGIEWYYHHSAYTGQEFITVNNSVLQYTVANAAGFATSGNKAIAWAVKWTTPILNAEGEFGGASAVNYDQWNIAAGAGGQATALNADKSQIFIGSTGADSFTGGAKADLLLAGAGNDQLFGGQGSDTYVFTGQFDHDTLTDQDGQGNIQLNGTALSGSFKGIGKRGAYGLKHTDGTGVGLAIYSDASSSTGKNAVLRFSGSDANQITIKNFDETAAKSTSGNGYLGLKIDPEQSIVIKASDYTTEGNPFKELDFDASTFAAGAAGTQRGSQANTTNSIALCADSISGMCSKRHKSRVQAGKPRCSQRKHKSNQPLAFIKPAQSAIEFVVSRSAA